MSTITALDLNKYLGKNISDICTNGYAKPDDNHCAHFVSHAMGYTFGFTCKMASGKPGVAANLRVHEVFAKCPQVGRWLEKPTTLPMGLIFVTGARNVDLATKTMSNIPKKHIGVFIGETIWHYSNLNHKVINQTPDQFIHHYPGPDIALFYGELIA